MKIAMVSEHASPLADFGGPDAGGQNVHVAELAAALTRDGHDVTVYTRRDRKHAPVVVTADAGYRVHHINAGPPQSIPKDDIFPHLGAFADELGEALIADRPHVIHAHFWMSGLAAILAGKPLGLPVVVTYHALGAEKRRFQGSEDTSPPSRIAMETVIARHADMIAATCTEEVFALSRMGAPTDRVTVVPCGVDLDAFAAPADPPAVLTPRRTSHRVVSVGRLVPRKGFEVAIEALAEVPDTELVIVGGPADGDVLDDPEGARLWSRAQELGVADRVLLTGRMDRDMMPAILQCGDLVLCTPWYEPFGMVPLEAMSAGTPVVAAAVGGLRDTVASGVCGELVPPRDPHALAETLNALLADRNRIDGYSAAGLERVRTRYTWARVASETARIYRRVVAARGNTPAESETRDRSHA
ncbi:glycosyltransferase [Gordonia sp. DT219]|uniref:glycosyltransferase n=1 Tax=Gordonia sp. DT219 TaxID=3416658 RepID=UPI003CF0A61E